MKSQGAEKNEANNAAQAAKAAPAVEEKIDFSNVVIEVYMFPNELPDYLQYDFGLTKE